jgi:O-antigen/teichoic acid export membrane protein
MIGRKSFLIMVFKAISAVLGFVGLFLITRYFPADAYGSVVWTMSFLAIFNSFADLGFTSAHIKRISEGKDLSACVSTFAAIRLALTGCMVAIVSLGFFIWSFVLGRPLTDTSVELIILFILYYVFYDVAVIATATFDARTKTAKSQIALVLDALVRVPLIIVLAIPTGSAISLAFCYVAGGMVVMLAALILLRGERIKIGRPTMFRSYLVFAMPIMVATVIAIATSNIDKMTIGFFWSSDEVARYAAAQSIISLIAIISSSLGVLLYPTISHINEFGDPKSIRVMVETAERYLSFILLPIACLLLVFPDEVALVLLSGRYAGSAEPMRFLAIGMLFQSLGSIYSTHILAVNRVREVVWLTFLQFGVLAILLLVLVPNVVLGIDMMGMGVVGAAIASLSATIIVMTVYRAMVWKMTGAGLNPRMLLHAIAGVLTVAALIIIAQYYVPVRWYDLAFAWLIAGGIFYSIIYALRELRKEDIAYFLEAVNPHEIASYIKKELRPKH